MKVTKTDTETKEAEISSRWDTTFFCFLLHSAACVGFGMFLTEQDSPLGRKLAVTCAAIVVLLTMFMFSFCMRPFRFRRYGTTVKKKT